MPRIRTVKPDLWEDEAIGVVCRDARLLFVGLITQADDRGRLRGAPALLKSQVFPYDDDLPAAEVEAWLAELDRAGLILRYAHAGRPLICLSAWERHQKIDKRKESTLPGPSDDGSRKSPRHVDDTSPQEGKGMEGNGKDSEATTSEVSSTSVPSSLRAEEQTSVSEIRYGRLSNLLADLVSENDPNGKRPTVTKRWLDAERLLLTADSRSPELVEAVIRWCQADDFERANVLSMPKLRDRFTGLWQKSRRGHKVDSRVSELLARSQGAAA